MAEPTCRHCGKVVARADEHVVSIGGKEMLRCDQRDIEAKQARDRELEQVIDERLRLRACVEELERQSAQPAESALAPELLRDMERRLGDWFVRATARARIEGESASITFELFGDSRGYTPADEPIYEVSVEEKFFTDHISGTLGGGRG